MAGLASSGIRTSLGLLFLGQGWYQHTGLKNTDSQTSPAQSVAASRIYDAFGNVVSSSGTWTGPFGYAGNFGYQADASGLKLLGHRYYDASTGRFLTRDPIKDGRNWYAYGAGEAASTNSADPTGLATGHHWVPQKVGKTASQEARDFWDKGENAISGPIGDHRNDRADGRYPSHTEYNEAVFRELDKFEREIGVDRRNFTRQHAMMFLNRVFNSKCHVIRRFHLKILRQRQAWIKARPGMPRAKNEVPDFVPGRYGGPPRPRGGYTMPTTITGVRNWCPVRRTTTCH